MRSTTRLALTLGLAGTLGAIGCSGDDGDDGKKPTNDVTITSFTAAPTSVAPGGTVMLSWAALNAANITINAEPGGEVTQSAMATGTVTSAAINANTTFTMVATGGGKTVMRSVSVTVEAAGAPTIQSFTATPMAAGPGTNITLRWATTNGMQVRVLESGTELLNSTEMVASGLLTATMGAADTTWTLEISNQSGMATQMVTVAVVQPMSEVEPNNDFGSASDANVGGGVDGSLADAADEDWFSFTVAEGGNVYAETNDGAGACTASTADTILTLFGPDGTTEITSNDDGVTPPCSTIDPTFDPDAAELPAGTYYIRVTGFAGGTGTYRLLVLVGEGPMCGNGIIETGAGEVCDDNNAVGGDGCSATCGPEIMGAGSTSLNVNVGGSGVLIPLVISTAGQSITATTSNGMGACPFATVLALGDEDLAGLGTVVAAGGCANIDPVVNAFAGNLAAGTYYIFVNEEVAGTGGPLVVDITIADAACGNGIFEPLANEQCEDGNTMTGDGCSATCTIEPLGTVTGLDQDQTFSEAITPAGQQDFFQVVLDVDGYIRAETGAPTIGVCETDDTVASILDSAFMEVARNDDGGVGACSLVTSELLTAGTYYVRIEEFGNNGEIAAYQVQITTFGAGCGNGITEMGEQCDDGNTTANDGCDATCNLEVDGTVTGLNQMMTFSGALTPAGDQDTYAVVLPMPGYITAETGAPTIGVCATDDTVVRIIDDQGTVIASNDEGGPGSCSLYDGLASGDLLAAGTYFVRVEEFGNNAEIAAYQVRIATAGTGCGNGALEAGEQCDDGNTAAGDGCDSSCMFEGNIVVETEANDTTATANPSGATIGTTVTMAGSIGPMVGDVDYYSFTVPSGMTASVQAITYTQVGDNTVCASGNDTLIALVDSQMTELAMNDDANGLCSEIDPATEMGATGLTAGTYFIRVQHYDNADTFGPYLLDIILQ